MVPNADAEAALQASQRTKFTFRLLGDQLTATNILLLFVVAVNGIAIYSFIALFSTFLREERHLALESASLVVSLFGIGQLCGGVPMGYVADRIGRRTYLALAVTVTGLAGYGVFNDSGPAVHAILAFAFGIGTNSIYTNCIAMSQEHVSAPDIPLVTGMLATVYFFTAAFSGWLLAVLKEILGWQNTGIALYTVPFLLLAP
jgi:MFS family permease